jgi:hypothetical protein
VPDVFQILQLRTHSDDFLNIDELHRRPRRHRICCSNLMNCLHPQCCQYLTLEMVLLVALGVIQFLFFAVAGSAAK